MDEVDPTAETRHASLFPLEFHLAAIPLSLQAKPSSKERWKRTVAEAARKRAEETVEFVWLEEDTPIAVTIFYFPTAPMPGDVDNIVKPILDALNGQAYLDDQIVERVVSQKFEPETGWSFANPTDQLAAALDTIAVADERQPVVYIRIDNDLTWRTHP